MSFTKYALVAAALGSTLAAAPAMAGEFDGSYEFQYEVVGTAGTFCPTIKGHSLPCKFIDADMRLYQGEFTEDSLQGVADQMIGDLEAQTGHQVPSELEDQIHAAVAEAWASVGDELNSALDLFPHKTQLLTPKYSASALTGTMWDASGNDYPVFGSINLESGDYVLNGFFRGYFDRNDGYRGKGSVEIPVASSFEYGAITLDVDGSGFAMYESWRQSPPPPPPPARVLVEAEGERKVLW